MLLVPPEKPLLIDEDGNQVMDVFGPFFEGFEIELFWHLNNIQTVGEQVTLSCEVNGGNPEITK